MQRVTEWSRLVPEEQWQVYAPLLCQDAPLMARALTVCGLSPGRAQALPPWIWERLALPQLPSVPAPDVIQFRADLLDTRPWYPRRPLEPAA
jgi:hypothetical protein